jgi:hypothetical protein
MSLIFATQLTAVATTALAVFAIVTAVYAILAFRKESQEVHDQASMLKVQSEQLGEQRKINEKQTEVLELQATELRESIDERKREDSERHRAQASRVFIHQERLPDDPHVVGERSGPVVVAHLMNASQQPVYNVIISWHLGTMPKGQRYLTPLMPGAEDEDTQPVPPGADADKFGAVAFFRDAAGVTWRTRPDGQLDEIPAGQEPPHTW